MYQIGPLEDSRNRTALLQINHAGKAYKVFRLPANLDQLENFDLPITDIAILKELRPCRNFRIGNVKQVAHLVELRNNILPFPDSVFTDASSHINSSFNE